MTYFRKKWLHRGPQRSTEFHRDIINENSVYSVFPIFRDSVALCVTKNVYNEENDLAYCDDNSNN